LTGDH